ncbi:MAG: zf-HC2 domain-containing protein [Actinobacteria bacterium]|nr:zf-HC2 domain-containing protein [Actinomycetota bacterium]
MIWHADQESLARYAREEADDTTAYSVEAHVLACADCRADLAGLRPADQRLERMWHRIEAGLDAPVPSPVERFLLAVGVRDHVARLLAATPSLHLSWLLGVAVALGFAVLTAHARPATSASLPFLLLAPLVPVAGVAAAYGPGVDPTYEIGVAAPLRGTRLLLLRALAVLTSSLALAGLAAMALPQLDSTAVAWLLPALGLTSITVAVATLVDPLRAAVAVALVWVTVVLTLERLAATRLAAFDAEGQYAFLIMTVVAGTVLLVRRRTFDTGRHL